MVHSVVICIKCEVVLHGDGIGGHTLYHRNHGEEPDYLDLERCPSTGFSPGCRKRLATEEDLQKARDLKALHDSRCKVCGHPYPSHHGAHRGYVEKYGGRYLDWIPALCNGCGEAKPHAFERAP